MDSAWPFDDDAPAPQSKPRAPFVCHARGQTGGLNAPARLFFSESQSMNTNIIEIRGQVHGRYDRSILFSLDGDVETAVSLSLAHVEVGALRHGVGTISLPAWLAEQVGLAKSTGADE